MTMLKALILSILKEDGATAPIRAMSVIEIQAICNDVKTNTVHKNLLELIEDGFVEKGFKNGRALTYYVTAKGIKTIEDMKQGATVEAQEEPKAERKASTKESLLNEFEVCIHDFWGETPTKRGIVQAWVDYLDTVKDGEEVPQDYYKLSKEEKQRLYKLAELA